MDINEVIERDRARVLAIFGVVDLAYGEDTMGSHALVFIENVDDQERVRREINRLSLLKECRVVIQEQLCLG